jgi:hypothetical protein
LSVRKGVFTVEHWNDDTFLPELINWGKITFFSQSFSVSPSDHNKFHLKVSKIYLNASVVAYAFVISWWSKRQSPVIFKSTIMIKFVSSTNFCVEWKKVG